MATRETTHDRTLSLGPDDDGRPTTAEEFAEAEYKGPYRYERVEGRLIVMSPEGERHADVVDPWRNHLVVYLMGAGRALVHRVRSEAWIRIDGGTDRIADIGVYLATDRPASPIPDRVPEIVFEGVSPGRDSRRRDYLEKKAEYFRLAVREYVVIDPKRRRVTIYARTAEGTYRKRILRPPEPYTSHLLPGLEISPAEVMAS